MTPFKIRALLIFGAAALAFGTTALLPLINGKADAKPIKAAASLPSVPVAEVIVRGHEKTITVIGHLQARQSLELTPRVDGLIVEARVPEGQLVRKGEVLFRIDPEPFEIQIAVAKAQLERAIAQADQADADFARTATLVGTGSTSPKALEGATALKRSREAEVSVAKAVLQDAEMRLSYTVIRAPIDGIVDRVGIHPGNQITAGPQSLLTRIVSTDELYVELQLNEATYFQISRLGQTAIPITLEVAAEPGQQIGGMLDFMSTSFNTSTGTLPVRAIVDNPDGRFKPGQFVRVNIPLSPMEAKIFVSEASIGTAMGGRHVQVVDETGTVWLRPVTLGDALGQLRVIETGLQAGDRVILKGLVGPGMTVSPVESTMPGADDVFPAAPHSGKL